MGSSVPSGAREPYNYPCPCPNVIEPIGTPRFARGFGKDFRELVMNDTEITGRVPAKQIEQAFSIERQLRNVDKIFKRVFEKAS